MPLYEYECENGHRFEKILKFSDPPLEVCPTCGAPVRKLMSSPAIQFKGSGWYITDYAKKDASAKSDGPGKDDKKDKSEKTESSAETKSESKTDSKSESKSEAKPAAKSEAKS